MRTSCIRHPESDIIVMRRGWQMAACESLNRTKGRKKDTLAECASELLNIFEAHYDNPMAYKNYRQLSENLFKRFGKAYPLGHWIPYSIPHLKEFLLNGTDVSVIAKAVALLETLTFISTKVPADLIMVHNRPMTWVRFQPANVNAWIDAHALRTWDEEWKPPVVEPLPAPAPKSPVARATDVDAICEFHRHIHHKSARTVYDANRKKFVEKQLKAGRSIGECAQAIIGCRLNDWNQGQNDQGKVYDDIDLIFRNAVKFERFLETAIEKGLTEDLAQREFKTFLAGGVSRYAKGTPKTAQGASDVPLVYICTLTEGEKQRYRDLARAIATFFITNTKTAEIMQFIKEAPAVAHCNKGITDLIIFERLLLDAIKVYRPDGLSKTIEDQARRFVTVFVKSQQLNSE